MINVLLTTAGCRRQLELTVCSSFIWGKKKLFEHKTVGNMHSSIQGVVSFLFQLIYKNNICFWDIYIILFLKVAKKTLSFLISKEEKMNTMLTPFIYHLKTKNEWTIRNCLSHILNYYCFINVQSHFVPLCCYYQSWWVVSLSSYVKSQPSPQLCPLLGSFLICQIIYQICFNIKDLHLAEVNRIAFRN